jgi:uncharacterized HAD superfamily protein
MIYSTKINPAELGFDFDGVIADTAEAFIRLACDRYSLCDITTEDITSFNVEECLNISPEIVQSIFLDVLLDSIGTGLKPMDGSMEVLSDLTRQTKVTIITARPEPAPVHAWLESMLPQDVCTRIHVIAMGAHDNKVQHIKNTGLTYFIDDRAETCTQLDSEGIGAIVFNHPWNRRRHNLPSVSNWQEIRALCL